MNHKAERTPATQPQVFEAPKFTAAEFTARRREVAERIGRDAITILPGAGPVYGFENFRQTNEFYYSCGAEVPQCYLLLEGGGGRTIRFPADRDPNGERSEGADRLRQSPGPIPPFSGADNACAENDCILSGGCHARICFLKEPRGSRIKVFSAVT